MLFLISVALLILSACLVIAALPTGSRLGNLLALISLFLGQIVLVTELLSELHAITRPAFLVAQVGLLGLGIALWNWRGRPSLLAPWQVRRAALHIPAHLMIFLAILSIICLMNLVLPTQYLTFAGDGHTYHLPRAYFWIQHQTAQPFFTHLPIMNEYPPNPSYYWMWAMLLRDTSAPAGLQIFQWAAGFWAAIGIAGWVRLAGYNRAVATYAGAMTLTLPVYLIQMGSIETDLLTAGAGFSYVYFAFASLQRHRAGLPLRDNYALLYTGLAFGLFLGSKVTAFFMLPGLGLAVLIYGWLTLRQRLWRVLAALVVSGLIGFLLFGSYVYVTNLLAFGHPVSSRPISATTTGVDPSNPAYFSLSGNLARYTYQVMDWSLLPGEQSFLAQYNTDFYVWLNETLNLEMEGVRQFRFDQFNQPRRSSVQAGYGVLGYLILLIAPFSLLYLGWRSRRDQQALLAALFILIGLSWLVIFSAMAPYDVYKMRHLPLVIGPLFAGVAGWLSHPRLFWLVGVVGLLLALDTVLLAFDRPHIANMQADHAFETGVMTELLPENSTVGIASTGLIYFLIGEQPAFDFEMVPENFAPLLASGEVDAVVTYREGGAEACGDAYTLYLPRMGFCVYTADPAAFRAQFARAYGYDETGQALSPEKLVDFRAESVRLHLPLLPDWERDVVIQASYRRDILPDQIENVTCHDQPVDFAPRRGGVSIYLPQSRMVTGHPFQTCDIYYAETVDLSNWTPDFQLQVLPESETPPSAFAPLNFDDRLQFSGFDLPAGYEYDRCDTLPLTSWWQVVGYPEHEYKVTAVLVPQQGDRFSQQDQVIVDQQDRPGAVFRFHQAIPLPCDLPGGLYDVQIAVYDPATLQKYAASDGRDQIHLTTIFVR